MSSPSDWRPWPGGGPTPPEALRLRVAGTPLAPLLAGLALRHALWTSLEPLPSAERCAAVGLPVPAELLGAGADNLPDRARIRRWLDSPAGRAAEHAARARLQAAASPDDQSLAQLFAGINAGHDHLDGVQRFGALLASTVPDPPDDFSADAEAGAAWLLEPGRIESVSETQRWPPSGSRPLREHRWLAAHLRLLLHLGGVDQREPLGALFDALPEEPPRWYEGWRGIPPDADSLGLWLRMAGELGRREDPRLASWLAPLQALPAHCPPGTWLLPEGEPPAWGGARCGGVQAALALGLLAARPEGWSDRVQVILDNPDPAWHYPEAVARAWLAEAALAAGRTPALPAIEVGHGADALALAVAVPVLIDGGAPAPTVRAGLRALARLQRPDGSWPASPYFLVPGKPPRRADRFLSTEVTTAACVRAMMRGACA